MNLAPKMSTIIWRRHLAKNEQVCERLEDPNNNNKKIKTRKSSKCRAGGCLLSYYENAQHLRSIKEPVSDVGTCCKSWATHREAAGRRWNNKYKWEYVSEMSKSDQVWRSRVKRIENGDGTRPRKSSPHVPGRCPQHYRARKSFKQWSSTQKFRLKI